LLDTEYETFLIDEPELGISPEAQGQLADFLFDRAHRAKYFSHIRTLVFATHSTVFLDRKNLQNNYTITKLGDEVALTQVQTQADFNRVHFFLLGNRFETLYLPSIIVLVEGKCDDKFISRALTLRYPNAQLSVISANSDDRIKEVLAIARGLFSDLQKSPYRDRIFVVLDSVHSASLPEQLQRMGLPAENVVKWPKNGIEYFYPPSILDQIFSPGSEITIEGDRISRNGTTYTKAELADKVVALMDTNTAMHPVFIEMLLALTDEKAG
jgi:hypothetical protein